MIQKLKLAVLFSVVGVTVFQACAEKNESKPARISDQELFPDKVVARGKNFEVKQSELENAFISYKGGLAARGVTLPENKRQQVESDLINQLIIEKVLQQRATKEDKVLGEEKAGKALDDIKKQLPDEVFQQRIKAAGMTMEKVRERLNSDAVQRIVVEREVKSKVTASDDEVKKFYEENAAKFEMQDKVRAAHILISLMDKDQKPLPAEKKKEKEDLAKKIKTRAEAGEDFTKLAGEFSEDPGSKSKGGEYTFGRGEMVKPFETAAFSLKPGEISEVVETQFGYHVIKLLEKKPAGKQSLDEAAKDIREMLVQREVEKQLPAYFEKIKGEAGVEIVGQKPAAAK